MNEHHKRHTLLRLKSYTPLSYGKAPSAHNLNQLCE